MMLQRIFKEGRTDCVRTDLRFARPILNIRIGPEQEMVILMQVRHEDW
jgi:hypothetical protein